MDTNSFKIIHIAYLDNNRSSGVSVVVPKHILYQQKYADVAFVNINGDKPISNLDNQLPLDTLFPGFKRVANFGKPLLIVFHEVYYLVYIKIASLLRKNKIPYVIVPHGCLTFGAQNKKRLKKAIFNFFLFNRFICKANIIQCLSSFEMKQSHFEVPKFISSNGFEYHDCSNECEKEKTIVYIGRLDIYHKGIDLLIQSIFLSKEEVLRSGCKIHLYGPGTKKTKRKIKSLISKKGLSSIINLNDAVFGDEKITIIKKSRFFVQTSRFEGMPLGILEAMSYGVPCLVTEGTTLAECVDQYDAGWTAENNALSISDAFKKSLFASDDVLTKKSMGALKLIDSQFNWDNLSKYAIEQYEKLFEIGRDN